LEDKDSLVRRAAADALGKIRSPQAGRALRKRALVRNATISLKIVVALLVLCSLILLVVGLVLVLKYKGYITVTVSKEILVHFPLVIGAVLCPPILLVLGLVLVLTYKGYISETGRRALRAILVYLALVIGNVYGPPFFVLLGFVLSAFLGLIGIYWLIMTYGIYVFVGDIGGSQGLSRLILLVYFTIFFLPLFGALYFKKTTVKKRCKLAQALFIVLHIIFHIYLIVCHNLPDKIAEMIRF
jgi:hypothetical protein